MASPQIRHRPKKFTKDCDKLPQLQKYCIVVVKTVNDVSGQDQRISGARDGT